ncbi:3'5'-cyclic nucleotide phosphodiesterase [Haematococcus lacustris]
MHKHLISNCQVLQLQVESCLGSASSWAFDAFQLTSATAGRPLSVLAYWLLHQSGLAAWAQLDPTKLARWLCRVEDGYCANPYHNRSHAADVVQTMHMLLTRGGLMPGYADHLTQLAAYLAAVCHDYQHIGRTNDWLVETKDELALRYNDRSPMENHHLAGAFSLLKHPDLNFLQAMPKATYDRLRKLVIELVLGTDMKQHFSIVGSFTAIHRAPAPDARATSKTYHASNLRPSNIIAPSIASGESCKHEHVHGARTSHESHQSTTSATARSLLWPLSEQDKLLSLQMALKCSDLGHLAAPLPVHLAWVSRLEAEFFAQGDAERAQGLPISPLCDRTKQGITKSQVGFFDFVALPLFNNFTARFTAAKPLLHGVTQNYRHWQAEAAGPAAVASPPS